MATTILRNWFDHAFHVRREHNVLKTRRCHARALRFYARFERALERRIRPFREFSFPFFSGHVLDVSVGSGANLPYYDTHITLHIIDVRPRTLTLAEQKACHQDLTAYFSVMDAGHMHFPDHFFDVIVGTFPLSSHPYPEEVLFEMKRTLKHGGTLVLIENTLSNHLFIRFFQHIHNFLTRLFFGFETHRDLLRFIHQSGFKVLNKENIFLWDIFSYLELGL